MAVERQHQTVPRRNHERDAVGRTVLPQKQQAIIPTGDDTAARANVRDSNPGVGRRNQRHHTHYSKPQRSA